MAVKIGAAELKPAGKAILLQLIIRIEYTVNDSTFNKSVYGYLTGGVVYTYPIAGRNQAASE